jgi:DNA-binding MarR family transcriptional regulator
MSADTRSSLPLGETLEFLGLMWTVDHALQTLSKRMQGTIGVTGPQRLLLRIVARFPGLPAGEIASVMHLDRSTISGILKRLERRGLVQRRKDARDGRRALIVATGDGRQLAGQHEGTIEGAVERALADLSAPQMTALRSALRRLATALEEAEKAARP